MVFGLQLNINQTRNQALVKEEAIKEERKLNKEKRVARAGGGASVIADGRRNGRPWRDTRVSLYVAAAADVRN